jgi:hypothetical protein
MTRPQPAVGSEATPASDQRLFRPTGVALVRIRCANTLIGAMPGGSHAIHHDNDGLNIA